MGKVIIISILILGTILSAISISLADKMQKVPKTISQNVVEKEAESLANYALNFAIKKLRNTEVSITDSLLKLSYTNFDIGNGSIDSLIYRKVTSNEILLKAYVHANVAGETATEVKSTTLYQQPSNQINLSSAITAAGSVTVQGSAEVNGDISENTPPDFEEIFGIDKQHAKDYANNYYVDPANNITPVADITWIDLEENSSFIISSNWEGSGILIVNGNLNVSGNMYFQGIVWIMGNVRISGNANFDGALFVESTIEIDGDATLTGNCEVNFDSNVLSEDIYNMPVFSSYYITNWN
jgi:hypothetical protein